MDALAPLVEQTLLGVAAPLWLLAGSADFACHRTQAIERSTGLRESLLHGLMLLELGIGVATALLLQLNAGAFALMAAAALAHEATLWWDLHYADTRRHIPWFEQWVHGLQQTLPWAALIALGLLHAPQALALFGLGDEPAQWTLRWKEPPLPPLYLAGFALATLLLVVLPFIGEWRRCAAARRAVPSAG